MVRQRRKKKGIEEEEGGREEKAGSPTLECVLPVFIVSLLLI